MVLDRRRSPSRREGVETFEKAPMDRSLLLGMSKRFRVGLTVECLRSNSASLFRSDSISLLSDDLDDDMVLLDGTDTRTHVPASVDWQRTERRGGGE